MCTMRVCIYIYIYVYVYIYIYIISMHQTIVNPSSCSGNVCMPEFEAPGSGRELEMCVYIYIYIYIYIHM